MSNSFTVAGVSMLASPDPSAVVDNLGLPVADDVGVGAGEGEPELLEVDAVGDGVAAAPSLLAPTDWPEPPDAEADGDGLADLPPALADDDGVGVAAADVSFGATSRTWRSRSSAVSPTRVATFCAPAPGTETTIWFVPCWTTEAPVRPVAFTRLSMIWTALVIDPWVTGLPLGAVAFRVTEVPLDRSSPRPTLKLLCQSAGFRILPPRTPASITTSSATRAARYRPG